MTEKYATLMPPKRDMRGRTKRRKLGSGAYAKPQFATRIEHRGRPRYGKELARQLPISIPGEKRRRWDMAAEYVTKQRGISESQLATEILMRWANEWLKHNPQVRAPSFKTLEAE